MREDLVVALEVGLLVEVGGEMWRVCERNGVNLVLESIEDGRDWAVEVNELAELGASFGEATSFAIAASEAMSRWTNASPKARKRAEDLGPHMQELVDGSRVVPGEPDFGEPIRSEYDPSLPLKTRLETKSRELAELGIKLGPDRLRQVLGDYRRFKVPGLVQGRKGRRRSWDPLFWKAMKQAVKSATKKARGSFSLIAAETQKIIRKSREFDDVIVPSESTQRRVHREILDHLNIRRTSQKLAHSAVNKNKATGERVAPVAFGDRVECDSTKLNNKVVDEIGNQFRPFLTVAMDVVTRMIIALILSRTVGQTEVAALLLEMLTPKPNAEPFSRTAHYNLLGHDAGYLSSFLPGPQDLGPATGVMCLPRVMVIDHGPAYDNKWLPMVTGTLGIRIEYARPYSPTDKPHVERWFRSLNSVLEFMPGYVGKDIYDGGVGREFQNHELLTVVECETLLKAWVAHVYHHTPHTSLRLVGD